MLMEMRTTSGCVLVTIPVSQAQQSTSNTPLRQVTVSTLPAGVQVTQCIYNHRWKTKPLFCIQGYTYHVKIINSSRKQDSSVRDLQRFHGKFTSLLDMRVKIMGGVLVPSNITFSIGYFSHHNKRQQCG